MNPGIFLIQGDDLVPMNEAPYDSEDRLQELLAKYPDLLVGHQIDAKAPRKWLFIERESGVPSEEGGAGRWAIDHLFLDQDAIPTIVEVKRSTDTRIRREVVGQMLDYAANAVVYWPVDQILARFENNCESRGLDPEEELRSFLGTDGEPGQFWEKASTNLQAGKVRLLFVADVIPTELQRVVEFLNEQMNPAEVLAVEIKQFVGQGRTGLVPRVIGQTAEALQRKSPGSENAQIQLEFWTAFKKHMEDTSKIRCNKPAPQNWMGHPNLRDGFWLCSVVSTKSSETQTWDPEIRVELVIDHTDAKKYFLLLEAKRAEIETEIRRQLTWRNLPKKKSCKIYLRQASNFLERAEWPQQHQWLRENLEAFHRVFATRVKQLDASEGLAATSQP